ncbi:MAG: hypothetical protein ACJAVY_002121, partial [Marinoscillum sp.]
MIFQLLFISVLAYLLYHFQPYGKEKFVYWTAFALKVFCAWLLGYVYLQSLQSGDTLFFHKQASLLFEKAGESWSLYFQELFTPRYPVFKGEARNELFIKILSVVYLFTNGNYWIAALFFSALSFFSSWHLFKTVSKIYPSTKRSAQIAFLFVPSVVFWSSGVLKDSIIFSAICVLAGILIKYQTSIKASYREVTLTFLSLLILFYLKFYLFALVTFLLAIVAVYSLMNRLFKNKTHRILIFCLAIILFGSLATLTNRNLNFDQLPISILESHYSYVENADFQFSELQANYPSLIIHLPQSLVAGLFRPWPWESNSALIIATIENMLHLLLLGFNIYYFRQVRLEFNTITALIFITILACFLSITTPNFGTLIRYKIVYLPFV